ncbi:hypothetical protein K7395_28825 [Streptomyces filamentosus]|uniref:Uncharacterized protein n=2 Tax=Streptomyces filamentosus TaxID=67294 RepID=A0ABY4V1H0_STRFL|nr:MULTISPECIES: hypothetical protein [Streptomyces]EFE73709.1 predicted protein [Streptomyces filamentosus NRRL 15998]ESU45967.1 hypothetical protein P376_6054 [Streptomyces sp. HCCB10043]EWS90893.1 hypothetical protein SSIG_01272 [Streptomyces filamentosus NRRL 11379]MYR77906.1 hypothetical protein [Streptomyces sp. SID5466]USC50446.1 hypothetical protein K7395_28825 [Streptomyces filamentosus]
MLNIGFTPDSDMDIPAGAERAWRDGRIGLATLSAADLRYGWFAYRTDFEVGGHAFLSAAREPLVDIMFTLAHTLQSLRANGSAEIDFTESSYVIRLELTGDQVTFTSSHRAPVEPPRCAVEEYAAVVRAFVATGAAWLVESRPAIAESPALHELRALVSDPAGGGTGDLGRRTV